MPIPGKKGREVALGERKQVWQAWDRRRLLTVLPREAVEFSEPFLSPSHRLREGLLSSRASSAASAFEPPAHRKSVVRKMPRLSTME